MKPLFLFTLFITATSVALADETLYSNAQRNVSCQNYGVYGFYVLPSTNGSVVEINGTLARYIPGLDPSDQGYGYDLNSIALYSWEDIGERATVFAGSFFGQTLYVECMAGGSFDIVSKPAAGSKQVYFTSNLPGAVITVFDAAIRKMGTYTTYNSGGGYSAPATLPYGKYKVSAARAGTTLWHGGAPVEKAYTLTVNAATPDPLTVPFVFGARPVLSSASRAAGVVTLAGSGFGAAKGYVDFGSGATNAEITAWTDTGITATIPAGAGCARVWSRAGGWSAACK